MVSASITEIENECAHRVEVIPPPKDLCGIGREKTKRSHIFVCVCVRVCVHKEKKKKKIKKKNRAALCGNLS